MYININLSMFFKQLHRDRSIEIEDNHVNKDLSGRVKIKILSFSYSAVIAITKSVYFGRYHIDYEN